jgi:hypothetical protein
MADFVLPILNKPKAHEGPRKFWRGEKLSACQLCGGTFGKVFYDCATSSGWRIACHACFKTYGYGLGVGRGQKYNTKTLEKVS